MGRALGLDSYLSRTVRDPGGSGRHHHEVGIRCRKCGREEWAAAPTPGWGRRIFKTKGWDCGNGLNRHTCPTCQLRRPHAHHAPAQTAIARVMPESPQEPATIHHLPEPDRPIIHVHRPTEEESPPMAQSALAEALAPIKAEIEQKKFTIRARGQHYGFTTNGNCRKAAREMLLRLGVPKPGDEHFTTTRAPDGTWSYALIGHETQGAGNGASRSNIKIVEGFRVSRRDRCEESAIRACHRLGVGEPKEGVDYTVSGSPGAGYVYRIIQRPAHPTSGGGFLSRFDAKKAAVGTLAPHRKTGGAAKEGVDYWITQDGFNMWSWSTTNPNPPNQAQPEPPKEELKMGAVMAVAEDPRKPTLAENRKIMEALDTHYDSGALRYRAAFSDQAVAQKLDLPRAWVATVREQFYGPEASEADIEAKRQKLLTLDKAVALAERAIASATKALEAASEVETLLGELRSLRAELR